LISLVVAINIIAQQSRLDQLGGLSYSIVDIDSQIDPYILGGNPAWLINSQLNSRLEINPSFTNSSGDYHRYYESGDVSNVDINFLGIKPLGKNGTFRGFAAYNYELQKDRNRILTLNPYSGDAFFFTDTTKGNYKYSGPTFGAMYSLEVVNNLFFGASINYQILDGLKKVYTFAETLYRNVSGNIGVAYQFSDNLSFGFNYQIFDTQERINASDVNNTEVQTFLYRGETFNIELRGTSQNYKIKKSVNAFCLQTQYIPIENLTVGLSFNYYSQTSQSLFPESSLHDVEDGYSSNDKINFLLMARLIYDENLIFGFTSGYNNSSHWSKNSKRELTIWEHEVSDVFSGVGLTFQTDDEQILVGAEYELHSISADSLKYINNRFTRLSALNHIARLGLESNLNKMFSLRLGYNLIYRKHDFIYGGENVITHLITFGTILKLSENIEIEPRFEYLTTNLNDNNLYKNDFGIFTTLRFYEF